MKSTIKSTVILSSGSLVAILSGLVSSKINTLYLGPAGIGYMGLVQSLVSLLSLISGFGIATALVRYGAEPIRDGDLVRFANLRAAAIWLEGPIAACIVLVMVVFRTPLSVWFFADDMHGWVVALSSLAVIFMLLAGINIGLLNAHHRVGSLALSSVINNLVGGAVALGLIIWKRSDAVPFAVLSSAVVNWLGSWILMRLHAPPNSSSSGKREVRGEVSRLLHFGASFTSSVLVGQGVQMALPTLVLWLLGTEGVGFYRCASIISVTYSGLLLNAMGGDYYPRVSGARNDPEKLNALINEQFRLLMILGMPAVVGVSALARYVVPLVYSREFMPTANILEWQLTGELLKFSSWTMSLVIMARAGAGVIFLVELFGGVSLLITHWLGMKYFGLSGLGIGFLIQSSLYYLICWVWTRRSTGLRIAPSNVALLVGGTGVTLGLQLLPRIGLMQWRAPIGIAFATIAGIWGLLVIRKELKKS